MFKITLDAESETIKRIKILHERAVKVKKQRVNITPKVQRPEAGIHELYFDNFEQYKTKEVPKTRNH